VLLLAAEGAAKTSLVARATSLGKSILKIWNGFIRLLFASDQLITGRRMSPFVVWFRIAKKGDYIGNKSGMPHCRWPFGN
jgi:hypothetical protein